MDALLVAIVSRALERVLLVAAGALAIYLGYRLFVNMPDHDKGSGKVVLPGGISIMLSRVGPGIFFSLFGTIIIGLSFHYGIQYDEETRPATTVSVGEAPTTVRRSLSGLAPVTEQVLMRERVQTLTAVSGLNRALNALSSDLPASDRSEIVERIHDAKLRLMQAVWDPEHWGEFDDFAGWLRDNPNGPAPPRLAEAVGYFRAGRVAP